MNGQLADVDEAVLVGDLCVQRVHLRQGALHEADQGQGVGRCELAVLHIGNVHLLQKEQKHTQYYYYYYLKEYRQTDRLMGKETQRDICRYNRGIA